MAIYHFSAQIISKSQGRNAVACAAYRSATKLQDELTGETKDYTHKGGVVYSNVLLCENAPAEWQDREKLWNAVQKAEKRDDAQLAREIEVALPKELSPAQQIRLLENYIQEQFIKKGMCADVAIHDKGDGNPHAHIMLTLRSVKSNGEFAPKSKQDYLRDENGERVPVLDENGIQKLDNRNRKQWKRTTVPINDWNDQGNIEIWREEWARACNRYLSAEQQIDHRSHKERGLEEVPTIHEGYAAREIEARGEVSERCEYNRQVKEHNNRLKELVALIKRTAAEQKELAGESKTIADKLRVARNTINQLRTELARQKPKTGYDYINDLVNQAAKRADEHNRQQSQGRGRGKDDHDLIH